MTIDIEKIEALAKAAGGDEWTPTYGVTIEPAMVWHKDGDSVCRCFDNIGHQPDAIDGDDIAEYIAAVSPAHVLALIAEIRALCTRLEIDPRHPYDGIYCRDETIRQLEGEVRGMRESPSEDDVLSALVAWFDVNHPDQNDFRARMRKAIDAARGAK